MVLIYMPSNKNSKLRLNRRSRYRLNIFKCNYPGCNNFLSSSGYGNLLKCKTHWKNRQLVNPGQQSINAKAQARDSKGRFI